MEEQIIREQQKSSADYKATIILTSYNRLNELVDTLKWLENVKGVANILIVDNGSQDATAQWLAMQSYEYIYFDEGVQGYGKLWNAVMENFETEEYIVFMEAGVYPERGGIIQLIEALRSNQTGAVSPVTNYFHADEENVIKNREKLWQVVQNYLECPDKNLYHRVLDINWRMWGVSKDILSKMGYFQEEIKRPEDVLVDYALRLIKCELGPVVYYPACAYERRRFSTEIYREAKNWWTEDRAILKSAWGQNYFNVYPNCALIKYIEEKTKKEFSVLEIGCDLGATLVEIKNRFPNCKTFGVDINEAAIDLAKYMNDVRYGNVDELEMPFTEKFDYIIFGDVLEHLRHPEEVVRMCYDLLNVNGYIIASIPNIMHLSVFEKLIDGRFTYEDTGLLDRTHIHFFTYYEIVQLFTQAGYEISAMGNTVFPISERQKKIEEALLALSGNTQQWMYETFQYMIKAQKA